MTVTCPNRPGLTWAEVAGRGACREGEGGGGGSQRQAPALDRHDLHVCIGQGADRLSDVVMPQQVHDRVPQLQPRTWWEGVEAQASMNSLRREERGSIHAQVESPALLGLAVEVYRPCNQVPRCRRVAAITRRPFRVGMTMKAAAVLRSMTARAAEDGDGTGLSSRRGRRTSLTLLPSFSCNRRPSSAHSWRKSASQTHRSPL